MRGQIDLKSMKEVRIWIENTGENLGKTAESPNIFKT